MNKPYFVLKVKNATYFYCEKCEKYHWENENVEYFYNVGIESTCMSGARSCSEEYAQNIVNSYNKRHEKVKTNSKNLILV